MTEITAFVEINGRDAIRTNCAVTSELPTAAQDLADLLVELALRQQGGEKQQHSLWEAQYE
jgi:hypothetical protein